MKVPLPDYLLAAVASSSQQNNAGTKSISSSQASTGNNNNKRQRKKAEETTPISSSLMNEGQGKSKLVQYKVKGNSGLVLRGMHEEDDETVTKLREPKPQGTVAERGLEYEEVKTLNSSHPYQISTNKQQEESELTQLRPRRNNSSDERRKSKSPSPKQKIKTHAQQLTQQLNAHLEKN